MSFKFILGGKRRELFSSGQKAPTGGHRLRWLVSVLMLLFLGTFQNVFAYDDWNRNWNTIAWDAQTGCIHYRIRYFQTWGGSLKGNCGAQPFKFTQMTNVQKIYEIEVDDDGNLTKPSEAAPITETKPGDKSEYQKYIEYDLPVSQTDLNSVIKVGLSGKWWRMGTATDQKVETEYSVSTTAETAIYSVSEPKYACYYGEPCIQIDYTRNTDGNVATYGDILLCDASGKQVRYDGVTSISASDKKSGSFYLLLKGSNAYNLEQPSTFNIIQTYVPSRNSKIKYEAKSSDIKVKAYSQIKEFKATADLDDLQINLNWGLSNAPSSDYDDSPFILLTKKTFEGKETERIDTIPYKGGVTNYNYSIKLTNGENGANYDFRIFRGNSSKNGCWNIFDKEFSLNVSTDHCYLESPVAEISKDNSSILLTWKNTGSIWSSGTVMKITRTNLTTSTSYEYDLGKSEYSKGMFNDDLVQLCNKYAYKIALIPGGAYLGREYQVDGAYTPTEIGTVKNLSVSKGYYSDKVELSWNVTSSFDEIAVERREYNGTSEFKKIQNVSALTTSDYIVEDKTCLPGVMYEYRVYGLIDCAGKVISSQDTIHDYGFRNPTADFYGRVTFENGQSVDSVEVRLETEDDIKTYALSFNGQGKAVIPGSKILVQSRPVTLQAWVNPSAISSDTMKLIRKSDICEMGLVRGHVYFKANGLKVVSDSTLKVDEFTHVTAVYNTYENVAQLYLNGVLAKEVALSNNVWIPNTGDVVLGENFNGVIDEVRLWSRALPNDEIKKDYLRYLVGNEQDLNAYYTFDFLSDSEFFDRSFRGSEYNGNTGTFYNAEGVVSGLSQTQLTYKGYTKEDGTYTIRAVPYFGNGTAYSLTPRKGTHQFVPTQEIRFVSESVPSHTVNFTDKSSFEVSGIVVYSGGTYPVEGVQFTIDGVPALSKSGEYIMTDASGLFTINVPVGTHEVKAVKDGHTFELDGRICNSDGSDKNYQDIISGLKLYDNTKVKYIGRVCGGTVQEEFPVGFSLSKNNLADDMQVVLSSTRPEYSLQTEANVHSDTTAHAILSGVLAKNKSAAALTTVADYNKNDITIHVNNQTGEFVAWVYPIEYNVNLSVYGHDGIMGDNSTLDLSPYMISKNETYEYKDTVFVNGKDTLNGYQIKNYKDSVDYIQKQVFTKRYRAQMEVTQLTKQGRKLNYFGKQEHTFANLTGEEVAVPLYDADTKSYTFGLPVFEMNGSYSLHYDIFEEYLYYVDKLNVNSDKTDRVAIEGATVAFNNKFAYSSEIDTIKQIYTFKVGEPDLTTAKGTIAATFTYGDSDNPTSVSWENPLGNENGEAFIFGSHQTGTNFVTGGPDKMLCVLRDPPGSNSYSYLEKGTSFTQSSTYTGSFNHEGSETWATGFEKKALLTSLTVNGTGATGGTTELFETNTGVTAGIVQEAEYTGSNSKSTNVTLTTRIQTSDDPIYDGANGDLYVGYSTNISFGTINTVAVVPIATYDTLGGEEYFDVTYAKTKDFAMVKTKGINVLENFNTMFAYPQIFIEQTLLPNLEDLRNSLLIPIESIDSSKMQAKADADKQNYYVSLVPPSDPTYAQEGSYVVYYTKTSAIKCDTINYLNQAIERWEKAMSDNDSVKAKATKLLQNYSFQAGANVEYSESYSSNLSSSHSFSIKVGAMVSDDAVVTIAGVKSKFEFEETFSTTQGGEFANEAEASHSKGFVLAEDGDDDYLSVDVLYEDPNFDESYVNSVGAGSADTSKLQTKDFYPTFVFRTRGGATSCPYEDAYKAVHWKGHESTVISAATMKLEEPSIDMPKKFIENVPSGEDAYLTVYMKNNSETGEDQWFDLRMVDASNPYGAVPSIDGNSMSGFALEYLVPAGDVLEKTIAITKGSVLNYDNLGLVLASKCQADPTGFLDVIADTVYFSVHFIPSCSDVTIAKPTNNWTYNTNCATDTIDGVEKHYMPITISGFDVNYTDFEHIELQYKPVSASDNEWITLGYYYKEDSLAQKAIANGLNAFVINPEDGGNIYYNFYMDNLPDQKYDLRAVTFCNINNELYENPSEVVSGIKDMYNPRLFGAPKPANGVLTIEDDIRIDFNETIAEGMLTVNNFEVTGIRNGAATSHDVAIALDGENDYMATEATRNFADKDLTFECWVNFDSLQNATFFSHGDANNAIEMGMNEAGKVVVKVGNRQLVSDEPAAWEKSSWNHVALAYDKTRQNVTAYVNYVALLSGVKVDAYTGNGIIEVGRSVSTQSNYFNGKVDQFRIWSDARSQSTIQANSAKQLSGNDLNLIAYYEMDEAKGTATEDKARGANLVMKGGSWALPQGRSASFDGKSYVAMNSASAVIASDMDFTLEFWFNAALGSKGQTILSSGDGIEDGSPNTSDVFSVGFDSFGKLVFRNNGTSAEVKGDFADNNWHNFTLAVNRSSGIARIYMDGELNTYFDADKVGRIASDKIYAGARVWHEDASVEQTVDQFFTGKVDEVRLWKLYRQQSQIESFYNQKVNGNEMGLLLYYPFEHYIQWQGIAEMQFTLEDKANENAGEAQTIGSVEATNNIPPVKDKGAVASLLYDWVVNDDALIITLREQDYRIEKTIVNFTVNKVQDVNGNYIVSPITWSAYIDRNQLKWMDDAVKITKKAKEPYSFEMPIVNNGGSVINYTLNNMPSWLSANVESGVINPLAKQTIEFEIDPSLAVGSYDEVVYLTNSNNVTEPLTLNVTVEGDTPDWRVDPSKYEYNMVVFAKIKVDGVFSNDEKDMLAAFYNGECVGVANMSYDKTTDMWYAMLTVYSDVSSSHDIVYRIWDASKGLISQAEPSESVRFSDNKVCGTPNSPVVFSNGSVKYQNIYLKKGWNWVSFNLENSDMSDMNLYLENGNWGSYSVIKGLEAYSANYSTENEQWVNTGVELNNVNMYKIHSEEAQVLSVSGTDIDLTSKEIPINKFWNYLSYLPSYSMPLKSALSGYEASEGDLIKSIDGFAIYYGNEWIGSLAMMEPNVGYMLKNVGGVVKTLKYPSASTSLRSAMVANAKSSQYESNMNVIAYAPEKMEGDQLRVLVANAESEVAEVTLDDERALQFINVAANNGEVVRFTLERDGVTYVASNQFSFEKDGVYGTPKNPVVLNFNIDGEKESLTTYPNPVVDELGVSGTMSGEADVLLEIFDVTGALVYSERVSSSDKALDVHINMSGWASGSYLLKVSQDNDEKTLKVVKK